MSEPRRPAPPGTATLATTLRRLGFLLRPQWLALFVVVAGFAYLCFTVLAPWQLGKNTRTSRENDQIAASLSAAPVPVTDFLSGVGSSAPQAAWRRVTATGHYLPVTPVLARLRSVGGDPAFEVLAPFAVDGGPAVLVDRGFVRPVQGSGVPAFAPPPTGTVTLTARLRNSEPRAKDREPLRQDGVDQVYSIDPTQVSTLTGTPTADAYLQLVDGQPGGLGVIDLPHLDAGPFLSYGIQWIAFGIVAPLGVGYFVLAEMRQRRRERPAPEPAPAAQPAAPAAPVTTADRLADRYGRRR